MLASKFGENLFWSSDGSGNKNPTDVVGSWMSEVKDYNYDNPDANNCECCWSMC